MAFPYRIILCPVDMANYTSSEVLRDGSQIRIRAIRCG